jgi:hypothetical protein
MAEKCQECGGEIKTITPPRKGICSQNCLSKRRASVADNLSKVRDTSASPKPQRGTQNYGK